MPKVASQDIVCYKYLTNIRSLWYTPYQRLNVTEYVNSGKIWNDTESVIREARTPKIYNISRGYIHSLLRSHLAPVGYYVFKCIIPKGSEYFKGIDGDICSKSIKFVKLIRTPVGYL